MPVVHGVRFPIVHGEGSGFPGGNGLLAGGRVAESLDNLAMPLGTAVFRISHHVAITRFGPVSNFVFKA
ncbi:hypothetical protein [Paraburkholderia caballeronis]|uniref:hypothetical protein n=1 Tax=Paraburkholderia caballeronis TaxID=416943 RepID=UPI001065D2F4|nr:hypothetical protein [Paraburkholderia caballeronis]